MRFSYHGIEGFLRLISCSTSSSDISDENEWRRHWQRWRWRWTAGRGWSPCPWPDGRLAARPPCPWHLLATGTLSYVRVGGDTEQLIFDNLAFIFPCPQNPFSAADFYFCLQGQERESLFCGKISFVSGGFKRECFHFHFSHFSSWLFAGKITFGCRGKREFSAAAKLKKKILFVAGARESAVQSAISAASCPSWWDSLIWCHCLGEILWFGVIVLVRFFVRSFDVI